MNARLDQARAFWSARSGRERILLAAAATVLLLGLAYALILEPLYQANRKLAATLPPLRADLRLLRVQVAEIERLRGKSGPAARAGGSLSHVIESSAAAHGVREALTGLTPIPPDQVRLATGDIALPDWTAWFSEMEQAGVAVQSMRVVAGDRPGMVRVEAVLSGGGR